MNKLSDYEYDLPDNLIAQLPAQPADHARLLVCQRSSTGETTYKNDLFYNLPEYLEAGSLMIFNDTKVLQARISLQNILITLPHGHQTILPQGEIFVYRIIDKYRMEVLVSDGKHFRPGSLIHLDEHVTLRSNVFVSDGILMEVEGCTTDTLLDTYGQLPLPPYIESTPQSREHYQTYWGDKQGSVAAPTASLHFTPSLRQSLTNHGINQHHATLHVGLGTFKPVISEDIHQHQMHDEQAIVSRQLLESIAQHALSQKPIIGVGTTIVRTLESLPYVYHHIHTQHHREIITHLSSASQQRRQQLTASISASTTSDHLISNIMITQESISFSTMIYITPGRHRRICNSMITNFHLPRTSLLMMVSALRGYQPTRDAYQRAIDHQYRFYSYGDAMLIQLPAYIVHGL